MNKKNCRWEKLALASGSLFFAISVGNPALADVPVGTAITYQGELEEAGSPVDDMCAFEFSLWDDPFGGMQIGGDLSETVDVVEGRFTVVLDFGGDIFTGGRALWLEIAVCCPSACAVTTLAPRQELTPAPHALALPGLWTQQGLVTDAPNLIGGYSGNVVSGSPVGATIGGGGSQASPNTVSSDHATVGGGKSNTAGGFVSTVGGGQFNNASASESTVGGGSTNTAGGSASTVAGGLSNEATGPSTTVGGGVNNTASVGSSVVSGGSGNTAGGVGAVVSGGQNNDAGNSHATVGGGLQNMASGQFSTVPGGRSNEASGSDSFAAGRQAKAMHPGTFVWADSTGGDFASTGNHQFLIRATGNVGIGTTNPVEKLTVAGNIRASGTIQSGSSIVLDGVADTITASSGTISFDDENLVTSGEIESTGAGFRFPDGTLQTSADTLAGLSCANGQVGKWNGAVWVCAADDTGGNTLDAAYDQGGAGAGRTITADSGAVNIDGSGGLTVTARVGIGTTTPLSKLDVRDAGTARIDLRTASTTEPVFQRFFHSTSLQGAAVGFDTDDDVLKLVYGGSFNTSTNGLMIGPTGNVGIGTTTPSAKLDVVGTSELNGDVIITAGGDLRVDGAVLWVDAGTNRVGIGTSAPLNGLHVRRGITGSDGNPGSYVALIENLANSSGADVLALKGRNFSSGNNFIQFFGGSTGTTPVGRIQSSGSATVAYITGGADLAEYLPPVNENEILQKGDIVGVHAGAITLRTTDADYVMAISTAPGFIGNMPPEEENGEGRFHLTVAMLGQVPVKVLGPVQAGELIVASGANDGIGVAVPPTQLSSKQMSRIVGKALESSDQQAVKKVKVMVGSHFVTGDLMRMVRAQDERIEELEKRLVALSARLER